MEDMAMPTIESKEPEITDEIIQKINTSGELERIVAVQEKGLSRSDLQELYEEIDSQAMNYMVSITDCDIRLGKVDQFTEGALGVIENLEKEKAHFERVYEKIQAQKQTINSIIELGFEDAINKVLDTIPVSNSIPE